MSTATLALSPSQTHVQANVHSRTDLSYHFHFGAGKLGLAFVLPCLLAQRTPPPLIVFQRSGRDEWANLGTGDTLDVVVNDTCVVRLSTVFDINDEARLRQLIDQKQHIFLSVPYQDNEKGEALLRIALELSRSFSCAVGPNGLAEVAAALVTGAPYRGHPRIYAFENDFQSVRRLVRQCQRDLPEFKVIYVMADRICMTRDVQAGKVCVVAEKWPGLAVIPRYTISAVTPSSPGTQTPAGQSGSCVSMPSLNGASSLSDLRGDDLYPFTEDVTDSHKPNVVLAATPAVARFLSQRKLQLVNGTHMTMTILAYDALSENKVASTTWRSKPLSTWKTHPQAESEIHTMTEARLLYMLSIATDDVLQQVYGTTERAVCHEQNMVYAKTMMERFEQTGTDQLGRILNLTDVPRLKAKYEERMAVVHDFFASPNADQKLASLGLSVGSARDYATTLERAAERLVHVFLHMKRRDVMVMWARPDVPKVVAAYALFEEGPSLWISLRTKFKVVEYNENNCLRFELKVQRVLDSLSKSVNKRYADSLFWVPPTDEPAEQVVKSFELLQVLLDYIRLSSL